MGESYQSAGVDIAAGDEAVRRITRHARSTFRPEVLSDIGSFGALFAMPSDRYRAPVLVSSTDGVGTKSEIARLVGRYDTIGIDLVAMCVDDLVCQGAEPLFFLDYVAVGKLDPNQIEQLVSGVAEGCRRAGCALIGGEMAEHPGVMGVDQFDLAGFAVGVVERDRMLTGERVRAGDVLVGLSSPGLRSNGYSLARRVLLEGGGRDLDAPAYERATTSLGEELLRPSVIYAPAVRRAIDAVDVHGVAHITGGGIPGNLVRVLPPNLSAVVDRATWPTPPIFTEIARVGHVDDEEMARVFNLGIGMIVVVAASDVEPCRAALASEGVPSTVIGEVVAGDREVRWR